MKKLLSILAAVGLTATASTAVVACSSTIKAKDTTATVDNAKNNEITVVTKKTIKVKMDADYKSIDAINNSKTLKVVASTNKSLKKADAQSLMNMNDNDEAAQMAAAPDYMGVSLSWDKTSKDKMPTSFSKDKSYDFIATITVTLENTSLMSAGDHDVYLYSMTGADVKATATTPASYNVDKLTKLEKIQFNNSEALNNGVVDGTNVEATFDNFAKPADGTIFFVNSDQPTSKTDSTPVKASGTPAWTAYKTMGGTDGKSVVDSTTTGSLDVTIDLSTLATAAGTTKPTGTNADLTAWNAYYGTHTYTVMSKAGSADATSCGTITFTIAEPQSTTAVKPDATLIAAATTAVTAAADGATPEQIAAANTAILNLLSSDQQSAVKAAVAKNTDTATKEVGFNAYTPDEFATVPDLSAGSLTVGQLNNDANGQVGQLTFANLKDEIAAGNKVVFVFHNNPKAGDSILDEAVLVSTAFTIDFSAQA